MKKLAKYLLSALSFLLLQQSFAQKTIYSQAKIYFNDYHDLQTLLQNGVTVDNGYVKYNNSISSVFSENEIAKAKELGFRVEIEIQDWQKHYLENIKNNVSTRNPVPCGEAVTDYMVPSHFNLGSMGGFLTYNEILAELDEMRSVYPNLITVKSPVSTFTTYENRPIYWVKISDNPDSSESEPQILYTALHHAREPGSMQQLIFYMWYLLENYNSDNVIKNLVDQSEIYVIPVVNPDGYQYNCTQNPSGGGMWRKNRRLNTDGSFGVDNNRNYSYHWSETGTSFTPSDETFCGTSAFSEMENQAIKWFVEQHQFKIAINNHTYSNLLLYPYSYQTNMYTPDDALFQEISSVMVAENHFSNVVSWQLYAASGDSDDWMYADTSTHNKIFSMTPEIGNAFWIAESEIIPQCKEMIHLNMSALKFIHNYPNLTDTSATNLTTLSNSFSYQLKNLTVSANPATFTVSIVPVSANIQTVGNSVTHSNLTAMSSVNGNIDYTLASNITSGEEVVFKIIVNNGLFSTEKIIRKTYGVFNTLFVDNTNNFSNWQGTGWNTTTSTYYSAPNSIADSPTGNYTNNTNRYIYLTPSINLLNTSKAKVQFYAKWNIEANYDYVQFEISADNGLTWQPQCGNYTNAGVSDQGVTGEPLYDGVQSSWVLEEISLNNYVGQTLKARFQIKSDGGVTADGFYFDDFTVKIIPQSVVATEDFTKETVNLYPNPATQSFKIVTTELQNIGRVDIVSLTGQKIKSITDYQSGQEITTNDIATGIYNVVIQNLSGITVLKLVVVE